MRRFRIIQYLPNPKCYYLQERRFFIWFTVQETIHSTYDDDEVDRKFYSIQKIEEYIAEETKPIVKPQLQVVKTIIVNE